MFGALQDLAGWRTRDLDVSSLAALKAMLADEDDALGDRLSSPGVFAVVNRVMVRDDLSLNAEDEVAFVPPMSGG